MKTCLHYGLIVFLCTREYIRIEFRIKARPTTSREVVNSSRKIISPRAIVKKKKEILNSRAICLWRDTRKTARINTTCNSYLRITATITLSIYASRVAQETQRSPCFSDARRNEVINNWPQKLVHLIRAASNKYCHSYFKGSLRVCMREKHRRIKVTTTFKCSFEFLRISLFFFFTRRYYILYHLC